MTMTDLMRMVGVSVPVEFDSLAILPVDLGLLDQLAEIALLLGSQPAVKTTFVGSGASSRFQVPSKQNTSLFIALPLTRHFRRFDWPYHQGAV